MADEVRKLAERAGASTKEITNLVKEIQEVTQKTVESVKTGTTLTIQAGKSFEMINASVSGSAVDNKEIAIASAEQLAMAEKVAEAVQEIAAISEESSASSQQTAGATQSLAHLATELESQVAKYNI